MAGYQLTLQITPVAQDVCKRLQALCSPFMWKGIGGPDKITSECLFLRRTRALFEEVGQLTFVKAAGGKKYGDGVRVCGWHIMHCTLREITSVDEGPSDSGEYDDSSSDPPEADDEPGVEAEGAAREPVLSPSLLTRS